MSRLVALALEIIEFCYLVTDISAFPIYENYLEIMSRYSRQFTIWWSSQVQVQILAKAPGAFRLRKGVKYIVERRAKYSNYTDLITMSRQ